jgi:hypothetical protein
MSRIELKSSPALPDIDFGILGATSKTVHFFRFNPKKKTLKEAENVPDIDDLMKSESSLV